MSNVDEARALCKQVMDALDVTQDHDGLKYAVSRLRMALFWVQYRKEAA